jgi:hypothetical protein
MDRLCYRSIMRKCINSRLGVNFSLIKFPAIREISKKRNLLIPFDGLTPLRGEWDEYFLLRALLNRRETKMSPQTYRWFVCSLCVDWWKCSCGQSRVAHHLPRSNHHVELPRPIYLSTKSIGAYYRMCVLYSQYWPIDRPTSFAATAADRDFISYLPIITITLSVWTTPLDFWLD